MGVINKWVAGSFVLGVLAAQVWVIGPRSPGGWYWPFMDYPMYSTPRAPDEPYKEFRLGLVPLSAAGAGSDTIRASAADLGMEYFAFYAAMESVDHPMGRTAEESEALARDARERVARNSQTVFGLGRFEVVLEAQSYEIDRGGLVSTNPPWEAVESWFYDDQISGSGPESPL